MQLLARVRVARLAVSVTSVALAHPPQGRDVTFLVATNNENAVFMGFAVVLLGKRKEICERVEASGQRLARLPMESVQHVASRGQSHAPRSRLQGVLDYLEGGWLEGLEGIPVFQGGPARPRDRPVDPTVTRHKALARNPARPALLLSWLFGHQNHHLAPVRSKRFQRSL